MKKAYSLDYDHIIYADARTAAVAQILNELPTTPNDTDLTQMADYIIYGKDHKLVSPIDTKDVLHPPRRFNSYNTKADKNESLEALMETEAARHEVETSARIVDGDKHNRSPYKVPRPTIRRTKYNEDGTILEKGDDFDNYGNPIPYMRDLWKRIDEMQARYDMYMGKLEPDEWVLAHPITAYKLYKMGHILIDLKRTQYYIKDVYNPELRLLDVSHGSAGETDYNNDSGVWLEEDAWRARAAQPQPYDIPQPAFETAPRDATGKIFWKISSNTLDYENPHHIRALLDNYVSLLKKCYPHPDSTLRQVCWDLERLIDESNLDDLEHFLLRSKVAHYNVAQIQKVLISEGYALTDECVRSMMFKVIPTKLANTALRRRLESDVLTKKMKGQTCKSCGRTLPQHTEYYTKDSNRDTGFSNVCKDCQKAKRERREANRRAIAEKMAAQAQAPEKPTTDCSTNTVECSMDNQQPTTNNV